MRRVLLGQRCPSCDPVTAAPKAACVRCGDRELDLEAPPTVGEVHSETTIAVAPAGVVEADGRAAPRFA